MASWYNVLVYGNHLLHYHYIIDTVKYLLLGLGISNNSVRKYFDKHGINYVCYDDEKEKNNINLEEIDIIVKSPGIKNDHFLLLNDIPKVTDLELFYKFKRAKNLITITGSNGKTTTVSLLKHLINDVNLGGNVGEPLFNFVDSEDDIIIEASSFMLEYIKDYNSRYSVFLNLYKTHIDHHLTFRNYVRSKLNLIKNVRQDDYIIYNYDDLLLRRLVEVYDAIKVPFSCIKKVGVYYQEDGIYFEGKKIVPLSELSLLGHHNIMNTMASIAVILHYRGEISKTKTFHGVEYRLEYVKRIDGIDIYNDSKSTNFHATLHALLSFGKKRVALIGGGMRRDDDFHIFDEVDNIEKVFLFGEHRFAFYKYFKNRVKNIFVYETLEEVVSNMNLENCDVLLFSPGCVSYDQFSSYIERGKYFNYLINKFFP